MKNNLDKPYISIIAAMGAKNGVLGDGANLPWHIPEDLKRFKSLTMGHPVIMGRKTWESLPPKYRPLAGRTNIVVTRNKDYEASGAIIATSVKEALEKARETEGEEIFIIGGASIYEQALPLAHKLYLTFVEGNYNGSVFFPEYEKFLPEKFPKDYARATDDGVRYAFIDIDLN